MDPASPRFKELSNSIEMEPIPQIARQRLQAKAEPGEHPDADLLTAFAEKSLSATEREQIFQHLAVCADCREVLLLAQPQAGPEPAPAFHFPERWLGGTWLRGNWLRWGIVAACAVVVVSGAVLLRYPRQQLTSPAPQAPPLVASARQAPEASLDRLAPPPAEKRAPTREREKDRSAQLQLAPGRHQLTLDRQTATESAVKAQADKELASSALPQKELPGPAAGVASAKAEAFQKKVLAGGAVAAAETKSAPLYAKAAADQLKDDKTKDKDELRRDAPAAPPPASTEVQVTASAPPVTTDAAAANIAPAQTSETVEISSVPRAAAGVTGGRGALAKPQSNMVMRKAANVIAPRWIVSSDGSSLLRSLDSGNTWQTVAVANNVMIRAVSAAGSEVWAGGSAGALYHSSDLGGHWVQVNPEAGGERLTTDIVGIDFTDAQHGKVTTATREVWITGDGGQSWRKNH